MFWIDKTSTYSTHVVCKENQEIRISLSGAGLNDMFPFSYLKPAPGNETPFLTFSDVRRVLVSDAYFEKSTFLKIKTERNTLRL